MTRQERTRPNILWICTDQQRHDTVHALGNAHIRTPNLDRLCAEGTAFTRAYCQNPICTPSRASMLTGLYPSSIHVNANGNDSFPEDVELITGLLAKNGYTCGLSGKLHLSSAWNGREKRVDDGYSVVHYSHDPFGLIDNEYVDWLLESGVNLDDIFEKQDANPSRFRREGDRYRGYKPDMKAAYHQTTWCVDRAVQFIEDRTDSPWVMSVNLYDPHPPFDAPETYSGRYDDAALPDPLFGADDLSTQEKLNRFYFQSKPVVPGRKEKRNKASYYGMIELIDEQIGNLFDVLERTGQRDRTVILFTSDHGEMLGDHGLTLKGCRFYEGLVHVPLIVSWPGRFRANAVCSELVELTDIAPTIAELANVKLGRCHGRSLVPILEGREQEGNRRDYVRCEYYHALHVHSPEEAEKEEPCHATMYFDGRFKLNVYHGSAFGELYDLARDPDEFVNLWDDEESQAIKLMLLQKSFDASVVIADPGSPIVGKY